MDYGQGNITTISPPHGESMSTGYIAAIIASLLFGSNFVPVKKVETGDGFFFQWVMCVAIWIVGLVVHLVRNCPKFFPFAMLGGFLWATGNIMAVPIIHLIGLAQGILIWGSVNMLSGWASSRFGWFGFHDDQNLDSALNYSGVALTFLSGIFYVFIRSDLSHSSHREDDNVSLIENVDDQDSVQSFTSTGYSAAMKKSIGCFLSVFSGILYGFNFAPVIYIYESKHYGVVSKNGLDYVFSHFSGIMLTSSFYFCVYCVVKKNRPIVYSRSILPAMVCGTMWGVACSCWFIANGILEEPVSFPLITAAPGFFAAMWGVLVFKEIQGKRNLLILLLSFILMSSGATMVALSKKSSSLHLQ